MRTFVESPQRSGKAIPFDFVLELLDKAEPVTRPMFGCTSVYVGEKIVLILRQKSEYQDDNGVWVATVEEHHQSLRSEFPSLRNIRLFGGGTTGWQNLPMQAADFETSVERVCEMILQGDARIGKIPNSRKKTKKKVKRVKRK